MHPVLQDVRSLELRSSWNCIELDLWKCLNLMHVNIFQPFWSCLAPDWRFRFVNAASSVNPFRWEGFIPLIPRLTYFQIQLHRYSRKKKTADSHLQSQVVRVSFQSYAGVSPFQLNKKPPMMPPKMDKNPNPIIFLQLLSLFSERNTTLGPTSAARCNSALLPDSFNISRAMVSSVAGGILHEIADSTRFCMKWYGY